MKQRISARFLTGTIVPFVAFSTLAYSQTTRTWDGGGTAGTNMETAVNWSGDALPNGSANDTAQWDGTVAGALALTYTAATANGLGAGNGIFLNILGSQTSPLTITQASGTTAMRLQNITIASGAGAFAFGNADAITDGITLGSTGVTAHTFTNNSSNPATFGSDVRFAFGGGVAKTVTFAGTGNWTFSGKFGNNGTGSVTSVSKTGSGTLTVNNNIQGTNNGAVLVNPANIFVKGGTMVIDTNGVVTTSAYSSVGQVGTDAGSMTLKGTGSFVSGTDFNVGDVGSSTGVLNVQDTAILTVNTGGGFFVGSANGAGSTASGTVNHSAGTVAVNATADGRFILGGRSAAAGTGGSGTYNLSGTGLLNNAGNAFIGGYGTGTFVQTGGTFNNTGWLAIGRQAGSTGSYSISGGALTQTGGGMGIIVSEQSAGTLTVGGSGAVTVATTGVLRLGNSASGNGTVNLNGGTLTTPKVDTAGGASTFNFNGGTLRASAGSAVFLQGLTTANVRDGGAKIDTNGNNLTINQPLLHSVIGGDSATDGGLAKNGFGTLTLGGANTYNGPTTVNNGTLVLTGSSATGNISLADYTTLGVKVTNPSASVVANTNNPSLTLGATADTDLTLDFNSLGNPTVPVLDLGTGVATLNGVVNVSLANTSALTTTPNNTTLALVGFGSQGGSGSWNLTTTTAGHTTFALNPTPTALYLNVTANPVTWTGAVSNEWNTSSPAAPKNWTLPDSSPADFISGDTVNFTNTANAFALEITEDIAPGVVNFSNSTNPYTIGSTGGFGIIAGAMNITGGGSVTIDNSNSYAGATTINAGTLTVNGALTASPVTLNTGTLHVNSATALGTGTLTINGGTLDSTVAGVVLTANGTRVWNGDFVFTGTNDLDLGTGAVTVGGAGDRSVTVTGTLAVGEMKTTGTQGFTKLGTGTLVLTSDGATAAASVVGGVLNVAAGTIQINRASGVTGDLVGAGLIGSGNITNGAATERWFYSNAAGGTFDFSGSLSNGAAGALGFSKSGASTQILSGNNSFSGPTTIAGGTLIITGINSLGGAVNIAGSAASPAILNLRNANALGSSLVTSTNRNSGIQLQGGITLPASVNFVTSNDGLLGATVPYAINNVSGDNTIDGSILLTVGGGGSIIQSDSGTLTVNGNISIAAGQSSRGIILQGASNGVFTGILSDLSPTAIASINKNGAGTWTISGSNNYTGATTVNAGTLVISGNNAAATGPVTVAADATLAGNGNLGGSVTIAANGIHSLALAANPAVQITRTITGALTNTTGSILNLSAATAPEPGTYTLVTANGGISALPTTITGYTGGVVSISGNSLILTISGPSAYGDWASSKGLTGSNNGANDDPDSDGVSNIIEFVLNGDPLASDTGKLPISTQDATHFHFDFDRRDDSVSEITLTFEYGTTLASWPSTVAIPSDNTPLAGPPVTITDNGNGTHHVKVTVAKDGNPKLFGRLKAVK